MGVREAGIAFPHKNTLRESEKRESPSYTKIHYGSPRSGNRIPTQEYTKKVQEALLGTPPNTVRAETPLTST